MQAAMRQLHDPAKAKTYFENKLAFTTGPVELDHMIKSHESDFTVIDVRDAEDYAEGHIPGAINVPMDSWARAEGLKKDKTNIVYCYSQVCHLGASACVVFAAQGFPVMEMEGGFATWKDYDLDIERQPESRFAQSAR
ncbi:MAG TPA: rhodanese-like domain-containing protein [Verrucomicrobiae bacterium]|nr:rhodanese-like domain-containing protein [Verrucomicrobiae bacterium]